MAWLLLVVAGLIEVVWALALKESEGFSRLVPSLIFLPLYLLSAVLLGFALRSLPVGTGYAVWVGIGAVGAALVGIVWLGESADIQRLVPLGLIGIGVVWLALGEGAG
ncbi:MAG: SMR family transporter [Actinomycetota bacterium]|nr:SMR family transporter [Actinomycetota bacterium]